MANLVGGKTVDLELVGLDGNAFALMGAFQSQARKEKWKSPEIKKVLDECMKGDYNHLLRVLMEHCEAQGDDTTDAEYPDDE